MTMAQSMRRGGTVLGVGYLIEHGTILIRNIVLARLLGPENFGVAATFLIVVSSFSMISDLGIEKFLIRARANELDRVQATLQSVLLVRGILVGGLILILSQPVAVLFGHPEMRNFYALAALLPLIEGLKHLDVQRQQRQMVFLPFILVQLGSIIPGAVLAVALADQSGDAMAVAWAYVASTTLMVALSHMLAREPFRLLVDIPVLRELLGYGWPLLLNGALIFLGSQGDRVLVGAQVGMADLAAYFAAGALTIGASFFLMKVTGTLYVPLLSSARDDLTSLTHKYRLWTAITVLLSLVVFIPMILLGAPLVRFLYGREFEVPELLVGWLAVQAGVRVVRSMPIALSLTVGSTQDLLYVNILRSGGLGLSYLSLSAGHGLVGVAASMAIAEIVAMVFAHIRSDRHFERSVGIGLAFGLTFLVISGLALGLLAGGLSDVGWPQRVVTSIVILALSFCAVLFLSPEIRAKARYRRKTLGQ